MRAPGGRRARGQGRGRCGRRRWLLLGALAGAVLAPTAAAPEILDPFDAAPALQAERLRGLRPEIARAILRDEPGGEIALAVFACPIPATDGNSRVALFVEIDGGTFLDANQARVAPVEIYAYALTPAGAVAGYLAEAFTLDVARHGEAVWNGGLRFVSWLQLPPGAYEMRVMVHNGRSLAHGLVSTRLDVPATAGQPALLPPLIASPRIRDPWLAVRGRAGWLPASGVTYPFAIDGRPLLPAARPVLVGGRTSNVHLFADRLPPGPVSGSAELLAATPVSAAASATAKEREVVATVPIDTAPIETSAEDQPLSAVALLTVRFLAPAAPPGRYDLRLRLDSPDGPLTTPPLPVLVIDAGPQDRELLWSDLKALDSRAEPVVEAGRDTAPEPPRRKPGKRASRRTAARYRQALAASTAGGVWRPAAMFDFEMGALSRGGEQPMARLRASELQVAVELGRKQTDLLLPLISLHDELFHLYRRRHLFSLVAHTRRLLEALGELYGELGGEPETAAGILASVGGYMQEMRSPGDSRRLFGRALERHTDNPPALLGLATSYEKYGEYVHAVDRLERLVAARPELEEARLRLALNLERVGDRQRYRELLAPIAAGNGTGWVSAIACQELARSLLEAGSPGGAESLLESALERMPDRQALWILLAHVHDRQGLLSRSWESLERVAASPTADARSERLTYDDWANGPLERARRVLQRDAAALRAALSAELGSTVAVQP